MLLAVGGRDKLSGDGDRGGLGDFEVATDIVGEAEPVDGAGLGEELGVIVSRGGTSVGSPFGQGGFEGGDGRIEIHGGGARMGD